MISPRFWRFFLEPASNTIWVRGGVIQIVWYVEGPKGSRTVRVAFWAPHPCGGGPGAWVDSSRVALSAWRRWWIFAEVCKGVAR